MPKKEFLTKSEKNKKIKQIGNALGQLQQSFKGTRIKNEPLALSSLAMIVTLLVQFVGDHEQRFMSIKNSLP